jgi:hypothetical protein
MRQTLTQPEEIDCILRAMAGVDGEAGAPVQDQAVAAIISDYADYMGLADPACMDRKSVQPDS